MYMYTRKYFSQVYEHYRQGTSPHFRWRLHSFVSLLSLLSRTFVLGVLALRNSNVPIHKLSVNDLVDIVNRK